MAASSFVCSPSSVFARPPPTTASAGGLCSAFRGLSLARHHSFAPIKQQQSISRVATTVSKLKTHKASAKRFKVTGGGILMRRRAGKQHLLVKKNSKRRKRLSKLVPVKRSDYTGIVRACPYMKVKRRNLLRSARRALTPAVAAPSPPPPPSSDQDTPSA
ncbi:uncharacterized protein LOC9638028 [Selaginella moellendorffii]|uniref:uncharacterized protein LOC9638028 n=1 Tax=Selaginella moellendorffii TaxID=88036 RepID=UPI000D1C5291|nr:uncharacterized protein LOC9638028 [Selaginella moellendorffii]|eukprot:XP_002988474.2 uncharacterized protein LOC9638028 [Selaginella moellendorffii]